MEINFFLGFEDPKAGRLLMFCRLDVGVSATQIDHGAIVDDSLVVFDQFVLDWNHLLLLLLNAFFAFAKVLLQVRSLL